MSTIIKQAETFDRVKRLTYNTGEPVNLTGCFAYSQMRDKPGGDLIATAECVIEPLKGRVSARFPKEATAGIAPGDYGFDIWLVSGNVAKPIHTESVTVVPRYTENFTVGA